MQTQLAHPTVLVPPVPPTPPVPPGSPQPNSLPAPIPITIPLSLNSLQAIRSELSTQLNSATSRRDGLARDLRHASADVRPGLQQHMDVLDQRIVQIENAIDRNGQAIVKAKSDLAQTKTEHRGPFSPFSGESNVDFTAIGVVFTLFVLCPLAVTASRLMWRRGNRAAASTTSRESEQRLERVEQAVDAIAVEVERISEGQRFVTQLLSKAAPSPALGIGNAPAELVPVPLHETVMAAGMRQGAVK